MSIFYFWQILLTIVLISVECDLFSPPVPFSDNMQSCQAVSHFKFFFLYRELDTFRACNDFSGNMRLVTKRNDRKMTADPKRKKGVVRLLEQ